MKKIMIPVFSAFAGYDSQFLALRRFAKWFNRQYEGECYIEFELVGWCEIDPGLLRAIMPCSPSTSIFITMILPRYLGIKLRISSG